MNKIKLNEAEIYFLKIWKNLIIPAIGLLFIFLAPLTILFKYAIAFLKERIEK